MRFTDVRHVAGQPAEVWNALHDREVLHEAIPGCERLNPLGDDEYAAILAARVGRLADTYRGTFSIDDIAHEQELRVNVFGRGRAGSLEVDLYVRLEEGPTAHTTALRYDATARVAGLVSHLGRATLTIAGGHITGCFFRDLDRAMRARARRTRSALATA
jgi:carbon monoxide dehydrogenase subunit G